MGFKADVQKLHKIVIEMQSRKMAEEITDEDAIKAMVILNFIRYQKISDVFLGFASINLMNVYVKQSKKKIGYNFKRHLVSLLKGLEDVNKMKCIKVSYDTSENINLLLVDFYSFQFSFQSVRFTEQIKGLTEKNIIQWDGVKKQLCAKTIFDYILSNENISNITQNRQNLLDVIEQEINCFKNGGYYFKDERLIKNADIKVVERCKDKYMKNYMREKLCSCIDRPVIISGKFENIWDKHITFTSIKPYIQGVQADTVCDHINLYRKDVEKVFDISNLERNQRYYIIGFCEKYRNSDRMGIKIVTNKNFTSIFKITDFHKIPKEIFALCHRFSIEEYVSEKQKQLKL